MKPENPDDDPPLELLEAWREGEREARLLEERAVLDPYEPWGREAVLAEHQRIVEEQRARRPVPPTPPRKTKFTLPELVKLARNRKLAREMAERQRLYGIED